MTLVLNSNNITIEWTGGNIQTSPQFIQSNLRGQTEWFAVVDNSSKQYITDYAKNNTSSYFTPQSNTKPIPFNNIVTTLITDMSSMFKNFAAVSAEDVEDYDYYWGDDVDTYDVNFNEPIDSWDTSNVIYMNGLFTGATKFNQPIGYWNISNVRNMSGLFNRAKTFNQPIGNWDTSSVTRTDSLFRYAVNFNQPIGNWNISKVTNMYFMFLGAKNFNQPIGNWDTSNVYYMNIMFKDAVNFNQPIGNWNTSNVNYMDEMFSGATNFNQYIRSWNVSQIPSEPNNFSLNSKLNNDYKPNWGQPPSDLNSMEISCLVNIPKIINLQVNGPTTIMIPPSVINTLTGGIDGIYSYISTTNQFDSFTYVSNGTYGVVYIFNYNQDDIAKIPKTQGTFTFDNISFDGSLWVFGTITSEKYIEYPTFNQLGNYQFYN